MSSSHQHVAAAAPRHASNVGRRTGARTAHRVPRYRRPRPARLSATEIALLLLLVAALLLCVYFSRSPRLSSERVGLVRVGAGQTVWELARTHPVAGLSTAQTAQLIAEINDLQDSSLIAGTEIRVPVSVRTDVAAR